MRCSLEGNSGNGFYVNGYAHRVKLSDSRVVDIGESGICFTGKDNYRPDKSYKCPVCGFPHWWGWDQLSADDIPMDCEASDNLVHDVGVLAKQCGGVFLANSQRIRVLHNHIYNTPRAGINVNNGGRRPPVRPERRPRYGARNVRPRAVQLLRARSLLVPARQSSGFRAPGPAPSPGIVPS